MAQGVYPPPPPPTLPTRVHSAAPSASTLLLPSALSCLPAPQPLLHPHPTAHPSPSIPRHVPSPPLLRPHPMAHLSQHPGARTPSISPRRCAHVPCHPAFLRHPLSRAGGRPGGGHPLTTPSPYLAEERKPAKGTSPTRRGGQRWQGRLRGRPVAPLADVGQCCHALLVPPVLCGEGQAGHDPPCHTEAEVSLLRPQLQPFPSPSMARSHPSPRLAVMYTHFLSLVMGRGLPGAQETKLRRDPSDHLRKGARGQAVTWQMGPVACPNWEHAPPLG